jgi:hypothetical protein
MRSIVVMIMLIFISELSYAMTLSQLSCHKYNSVQYSTMAPDDPIMEEQNGKLLFPIFDPRTGKYTFSIERGKEIIQERFRASP